MKPVSVSVPLTLAEAWRDRAKRDRTSQVDVLFDAIVAHQDELDDLVAAAAEKPTVNDGLFDRGTDSKGERFVGVSLRMKSGNLDVIDRLADKHGAEKRSPFVAAVLAAYLATQLAAEHAKAARDEVARVWAETGEGPTWRELAAALGVKSSLASAMIDALHRRGALTSTKEPRSLAVTPDWAPASS